MVPWAEEKYLRKSAFTRKYSLRGSSQSYFYSHKIVSFENKRKTNLKISTTCLWIILMKCFKRSIYFPSVIVQNKIWNSFKTGLSSKLKNTHTGKGKKEKKREKQEKKRKKRESKENQILTSR